MKSERDISVLSIVPDFWIQIFCNLDSTGKVERALSN
jgi:hypothetical protein